MVKLHLRARDDVEAHAEEDFLQFAQHLLERVALAARGQPARQRDVDLLGGEARRERGGLKLLGAAGDIRRDGLAHLVRQRADDGPLLGRQLTHLL